MPTRHLKKVVETHFCFLCQIPCEELCPYCKLVYFCGQDHFKLHHVQLDSTTSDGNDNRSPYCFPYRADYKEGIGRILVATRTIKPMELILVDPGTVKGPNYTTTPACLECLLPVSGEYVCSGCEYPMCSAQCSSGANHREECVILGRCKAENRPSTLQIKDPKVASNALSVVTPLRLLLLQEKGGDEWKRSDQLMDHIEDRQDNKEEWEWYEKYLANYYRNQLGLSERFTSEEIHHAIGLINVNSVALQFPKQSSLPKQLQSDRLPEGKGLYPIFAIMSHYCVCNARYSLNPATLMMYVRARSLIRAGDEISVQYLSALYGNYKRRRKIREEWYFDCKCRRCSDPTECGSYVSAVKCEHCILGNMLPVDSLDNDSEWKCGECFGKAKPEKIESLLKPIEEELEEIGSSGNFENYENFLLNYSDFVLHPNHYLLMTAARNLVQFYTYSSPNESLSFEKLEKKFELCQRFESVLSKIDPGYSEIRTFIQKELNFSRLLLSQKKLGAGLIAPEDYLHITRQSLKALDEMEKCKRLLLFNCG